VLIGLVLLGAYYALIFGYAWHARVARGVYVAWRFPLRGGTDLTADALADGTVVCSTDGTLFFVGADGNLRSQFEAYDSPYEKYSGSLSPYEGYQWHGWAAGNMLLVTVTRPPVNQLELVALGPSGKQLWSAPLPPDAVSTWIDCSADRVYLLAKRLGTGPHKTEELVQCYSKAGQLVYTTRINSGVYQLVASADNWVYLTDEHWKSVSALDPQGKVAWTTPGAAGWVPIYSNFGGNGTLYCYTPSSNTLCAYARKDGAQVFAAKLGPYKPPVSQPGNPLLEALGLGGAASPYSNYGYGWSPDPRVADGGGMEYCIDAQKLYAVDAAGKLRWQQALPSLPLAVAAGQDGTAYVLLTRGGLRAYSPAGRELWANTTLADPKSAISLGPDGKLYVEADGELICFQP